jgi:hypothetical protein
MPDKKRVRHRDIDVRSLARGYTELSVRVLGGIAKDGTSAAAYRRRRRRYSSDDTHHH